ncbi:hypothetical protein EV1_033668 [Malus domestica]
MLSKASPSMGIKYTNVEEPSNVSLDKRHVQALSRSERHKQMKVTESDACVVHKWRHSDRAFFGSVQTMKNRNLQ